MSTNLITISKNTRNLAIKSCGDHQHINQNIHPSPSKWRMIKDNHYLKAKPSTAFVYSIIKRSRNCKSIFLNTFWLPTDIENIISFPFYMYANALFPLCRVLAIPSLIKPSTGFESLQLTIWLRVSSYEVKDSAKLGNRSKYLWK